MLHDFITAHRDQIIARTREKLAGRLAPLPTEIEMLHGVPLFLDQLAARLESGGDPAANQIGESASLHGGELLRRGFTIGLVVHDYGNICQAITELAVERGARITTDEFRTLNLCLDVAIAEAVSEYARQREATLLGQGVENIGFLAHELRNLLNTATLAFDAVASGSVGIGGSTGSLLAKSLSGMRDVVSRSLADVRLRAGPPRRERVLVLSLLEEIAIAAALYAKNRDIRLSVEPHDPALVVDGDSLILTSILTNLLQNACKFTKPHGTVTLRVRSTPDRVLIDVGDECGGFPPEKVQGLFEAREQHDTDEGGMGLGLVMSRSGARAIGADLVLRDEPGVGCVFTLDAVRAPGQAATA